jgi:hypothetical protein
VTLLSKYVQSWSKHVKTKDSFAMLALLPCVVSFAAAASACEKAAQWQFALELLKEAKQAKSPRIDVNLLQLYVIFKDPIQR